MGWDASFISSIYHQKKHEKKVLFYVSWRQKWNDHKMNTIIQAWRKPKFVMHWFVAENRLISIQAEKVGVFRWWWFLLCGGEKLLLISPFSSPLSFCFYSQYVPFVSEENFYIYWLLLLSRVQCILENIKVTRFETLFCLFFKSRVTIVSL